MAPVPFLLIIAYLRTLLASLTTCRSRIATFVPCMFPRRRPERRARMMVVRVWRRSPGSMHPRLGKAGIIAGASPAFACDAVLIVGAPSSSSQQSCSPTQPAGRLHAPTRQSSAVLQSASVAAVPFFQAQTPLLSPGMPFLGAALLAADSINGRRHGRRPSVVSSRLACSRACGTSSDPESSASGDCLARACRSFRLQVHTLCHAPLLGLPSVFPSLSSVGL